MYFCCFGRILSTTRHSIFFRSSIIFRHILLLAALYWFMSVFLKRILINDIWRFWEEASERDFKDLRQREQAGRRGLKIQRGRRTEKNEKFSSSLLLYSVSLIIDFFCFIDFLYFYCWQTMNWESKRKAFSLSKIFVSCLQSNEFVNEV